ADKGQALVVVNLVVVVLDALGRAFLDRGALVIFNGIHDHLAVVHQVFLDDFFNIGLGHRRGGAFGTRNGGDAERDNDRKCGGNRGNAWQAGKRGGDQCHVVCSPVSAQSADRRVFGKRSVNAAAAPCRGDTLNRSQH